MEFTEIFAGVAVVLVLIVAIFGMTTSWNTAYGSSVGEDAQFTTTRDRVENLLEDQFVDRGLEYAQSTQAQAGAGSTGSQDDNIIKRALRTIGLINELVGLAPALIKDGAVALNVPAIYWRIAQALFWVTFSITLAYLLITGARSIRR
ncbi:MAG: hypothetical protein LC650_05035 [Actinobacteria bacterium]|nr:hypothetical protein [Actinomycetota bacterium]